MKVKTVQFGTVEEETAEERKMSIVKLSPYSSICALRIAGYNHQFRSMGSSIPLRSPSTIDKFNDTDTNFANFCVPDVDSSPNVIEAYDTYRILIDLPGMNKEDINLTLNSYFQHEIS